MTRPLAYHPKYALNAICPYFTMFPIEYPLRILQLYRRDGVIVMDPFCGRGTTLFAARMLRMGAWGVDTSPVAVAIAKAKLATSSAKNVLALARDILANVIPQGVPATEFFHRAFHPETLFDICALREGLLERRRDSNAAVILRATLLGCLHGPVSKQEENMAYLSNQMPRTFAPKPDYAVRYWRTKGLRARRVDIIDVLRRKLARIAFDDAPDGHGYHRVRLGDSGAMSSFPKQCRDFSVVVTSPPYYGMKTYVQDQWLRNWFLGGPSVVDYYMGKQLSYDSQDAFAESLAQVWDNMAASRAKKLDMHIRFGALPSMKVDARELLCNSIEASKAKWRLASVRHGDTANVGKRQADQMQAISQPLLEYDFYLTRQ